MCGLRNCNLEDTDLGKTKSVEEGKGIGLLKPHEL